MASDSTTRRAVRRLLHRLMPDRLYSYVQAVVMANDIRSGTILEPEMAFLPLAVRSGDTVIDIGANSGMYSYPLSRIVGSSGQVYAFEPVPSTYRTLRIVARLLRMKNVQMFSKGCSDHDERCVFSVPVQASGAIASGLAHRRPDDPAAEPQPADGIIGMRDIEVELVALDDFLPSLNDISFVKCDVEGAELSAFTGFERTIALHQPTVLCEVERRHLTRLGFRREQVFAFFTDRGYRCFVWEDGALVEFGDSRDLPDGNVIFVHPRRLDRVGLRADY